MRRTVTETAVLPAASQVDTRQTAAAVLPRRDVSSAREVGITAVEKTEDGVDEAAFEGETERTGAALEIAARFEGNGGPIETALEADAAPIVLMPRSASCRATPFSGDTGLPIVTNTDRPLIVVPDPEETN